MARQQGLARQDEARTAPTRAARCLNPAAALLAASCLSAGSRSTGTSVRPVSCVDRTRTGSTAAAMAHSRSNTRPERNERARVCNCACVCSCAPADRRATQFYMQYKKMHPPMHTQQHAHTRTHRFTPCTARVSAPHASGCQSRMATPPNAKALPACVHSDVIRERWPLWCYNSSGEYRGCQRTRPRRRRYLHVLAMH